METFPFLLKFDFTECFLRILKYKIRNIFIIFQSLNVFLGSTCSMSFVASDEDYVITTTSDDVDS